MSDCWKIPQSTWTCLKLLEPDWTCLKLSEADWTLPEPIWISEATEPYLNSLKQTEPCLKLPEVDSLNLSVRLWRRLNSAWTYLNLRIKMNPARTYPNLWSRLNSNWTYLKIPWNRLNPAWIYMNLPEADWTCLNFPEADWTLPEPNWNSLKQTELCLNISETPWSRPNLSEPVQKKSPKQTEPDAYLNLITRAWLCLNLPLPPENALSCLNLPEHSRTAWTCLKLHDDSLN